MRNLMVLGRAIAGGRLDVKDVDERVKNVSIRTPFTARSLSTCLSARS